MRNWRCVVTLGVALFATTLAVAQARHTPTFDEQLSLKTVGSPLISPDGQFVAYRLEETNWKDNEYVSQWWLANLATGKQFQLTRAKKAPGDAQWSPDGKWLAFVAQRESSAIEPLAPEKPADKPAEKSAEKKDDSKDTKKEDDKGDDSGGKVADQQIWLISPYGGEAWQLTKSASDVSGFQWSKDGKSIAFSANPVDSKAQKDRKEKFSDYEVFEKDFGNSQLWLVDVSKALLDFLPVAPKQLTKDADWNINSFNWSPDSKTIAFSATKNPLLAFSGEEDIFLLDLAKGNTVTKIVALPGPDSGPVFSPDGRQIAFHTALGEPYFFYKNGHIATVDLDAVRAKTATSAKDLQDLTAKFDEDPWLIDWTAQGIVFGAEQKTATHAFRIDPKSGAISRITAPDALMLYDVTLTPDGKKMAFVAESPTQMGEIFVSDTSNFVPRKLTDMTAQTRDWNLGTPEVISWKSQDGTAIEGILYKPANFDPSKKYPLMVVIHGGPTGTSHPALSAREYAYPKQAFMAKGALILEPNYRGSAGYGEAFRSLNVRNLGVGDMWDVLSGVDSLIAKGIVDPDKLAAMGWSQGGYISAFLTTNTDRFKAISVGAGISDWMTYYVSTDITPFTPQYLHATPWDDPAVYAKTSPITNIKKAKTPTLIQAGSNDKRVPVPDSFELYRGLQDQGVPARLILYTGFGHGVSKPKSQRALLQANWDWFNHYIWGELIPAESPLNGTSELPAGK